MNCCMVGVLSCLEQHTHSRVQCRTRLNKIFKSNRPSIGHTVPNTLSVSNSGHACPRVLNACGLLDSNFVELTKSGKKALILWRQPVWRLSSRP